MIKLQKVDELLRIDHAFLGDIDECYFMLSYAARKGYSYSPDNQLISNLKKRMDRKQFPKEWKHKEDAIIQIAENLDEVNLDSVFSDKATYIPIPPSKVRSDPMYDDRLVKILSKVNKGNLDIREIIEQQDNTEECHLSDAKRNISSIQDNYIINKDLAEGMHDIIIVFDDVLTTGAHFVAAKNILKHQFPESQIKGLFIARRILQDFDFE